MIKYDLGLGVLLKIEISIIVGVKILGLLQKGFRYTIMRIYEIVIIFNISFNLKVSSIFSSIITPL